MIVLIQLTGAIIKCRDGLQDKQLKYSIIFYCYAFYYPTIWYYNKITCLDFICEGEDSTTVPPRYIYPNIQDVTTCFSCSPSDVNVNFSSTVSSTCICVQNHCHRAKAQLQLNKYYYYKVVELPSGGSNYRPKHVAVNVMNEYTLIYCVVLIGQSITNTG